VEELLAAPPVAQRRKVEAVEVDAVEKKVMVMAMMMTMSTMTTTQAYW
jgi:hypothetical protein